MRSMPKPAVTEGQGSSLPALCSEAADHVARARLSLSLQTCDADRALAHLDEALHCLKRLLAKGRTPPVNTAAIKRSA